MLENAYLLEPDIDFPCSMMKRRQSAKEFRTQSFFFSRLLFRISNPLSLSLLLRMYQVLLGTTAERVSGRWKKLPENG